MLKKLRRQLVAVPVLQNKVKSDVVDSLTLRFPFPSDLNTGLGGRKRRESNTEAGLTALEHVG